MLRYRYHHFKFPIKRQPRNTSVQKNNVTRTFISKPIATSSQSRSSINSQLHLTKNSFNLDLVNVSNSFQVRNYASEVGSPLAMPALSPTMEKGNIASWNKKVGDEFQTGDVLCEVETDKATVEFEAPDDGYLAAILVEAGSVDIPIGKPIGVMVDDKSDIEQIKPKDFVEESSSGQSSDSTQTTKSEPAPDVKHVKESDTANRQVSGVLSPAVRSLVDSYNLDASLIPATGPKSRLLKGDVLKVLNSDQVDQYKRTIKGSKQQSQTQQQQQQSKSETKTPHESTSKQTKPKDSLKQPDEGDFEDLSISQMRQVIAQRLVESKQTLPHAYQTIEAQVDQVLSFRQKLKDLGFRVSVNDIIIKASALALRDVPECNVINGKTSETVDVSVAVATDRGLITPIVKNAATLGLSEISERVKDLATRARDNKLKPEEFQGGSFSISNLGMFGISEFKAVINPPQGIILAIGGTEQKVIMKDDPLGKIFETEEEYENAMDRAISLDNSMEVGNFMSASASLSNVHVDPVHVSLFMNKFKKYIENPQTLVL
eukprot:gb/GECH01013131.1/.p1 GENE.gb/GECH01013131.1/~~gb/GECH01013131.1/.p1  ORF type:complete len:545 (+),score=118.30 gb/GECH01013131.1/:1-1635(+)